MNSTERLDGADPNTSTPVVIAHRGASGAHPENTLAAFEAAGPLGADWVELDVRLLADGALVVHHDANLPDGRLLATLRGDDVPAWVPTLTAALDACLPLGVNVEIKSWPDEPGYDPGLRVADEVAALLGQRVREQEGRGVVRQRLLVSAFEWEVLDRVREVAPELETAWLYVDPQAAAGAVRRCADAGHQAIHPWCGYVDAALVAEAHRAGLRCNTWTVDDPGVIAALAAMGVDGIVTNHPDVARRVLDGLVGPEG